MAGQKSTKVNEGNKELVLEAQTGSKCLTISERRGITLEKSDAETHRTPKALACEMTQGQQAADSMR
jgi:hypothetical protein